jgi:hypothetical protein
MRLSAAGNIGASIRAIHSTSVPRGAARDS